MTPPHHTPAATGGPGALALDIGGVHIKAVHSCGAAWSVPVVHEPVPQRLADTLNDLVVQAPPFDRVLLTMTADLCDAFATRRQGVRYVLDAARLFAADRPIRVWRTDGRFADLAEAYIDPLPCASANWHALATLIAGWFPRGLLLLVDTGSTTTDIIPLSDGRPVPRGLTDTQRLAAGELIYLGAYRTPLEALGPRVEWRGCSYYLMAEWFADMTDVLVLTGCFPEDPKRRDTTDGRPMLRPFAAARLLRMIGADLEQMSLDDAADLATVFAETARHRIAHAVTQALDGRTPQHVVVAGNGDFLASAAASIALPGVPQTRLADRIGPDASAAACAYALLQVP
jgi:hypothetical protein